jgi:hypothetical protein
VFAFVLISIEDRKIIKQEFSKLHKSFNLSCKQLNGNYEEILLENCFECGEEKYEKLKDSRKFNLPGKILGNLHIYYPSKEIFQPP